MKKYKTFKTKKLHYNEFLYKLIIPSRIAGYFRKEFQKDGNFSYARLKLDVLTTNYKKNEKFIKVDVLGSRFYNDRVTVDDYLDGIEIYKKLKQQPDTRLRCEINTLILYSNDKKFLLDLVSKLKTSYIEFWEPDPDDVNLLQKQENIIIVNETPNYEYKITLGKGKGNPSLASWIDANPKLGKMGEVAKGECYNNGYVKGYYFFVKDDKALLIAQMLIGNNIQRIEKLVYKSK